MIWKQQHLCLASDQIIILEKQPGCETEYQFHIKNMENAGDATFILYIDKGEIKDFIKELQHLINEP